MLAYGWTRLILAFEVDAESRKIVRDSKVDPLVGTTFDIAAADLKNGCFILLGEGEYVDEDNAAFEDEENVTNFVEVIAAFGVASWSSMSLLFWGVVGPPEQRPLSALLTGVPFVRPPRLESGTSLSF